MAAVTWFLLVANVAILPYFLFLLMIAIAAILAKRSRVPAEPARSRFLIVIPAHDEESGIGQTVRSCRASVYPESLFDVLVIADNCTDRTAELAADAGARVVTRFDDEKKSKGYAIEFVIERLVESREFDTLDALVVIDADTTIDADLLLHFDADVRAGLDWVQCYYMVANPDQSWRTRLMTYAFSLINGVMLLGQSALGTSGGFRGNGMCFTTRGLRRRPYTSYGLVEDMEYSWTLRVSGEKIAFEPSACVHGAMLGSAGTAAANQRRRWEFGRNEIRRKFLGCLLGSKQLAWWEKLISFLELSIPSMGMLLALYIGLSTLDLLACWEAPSAYGSTMRWTILSFWSLLTVSLGAYAISPFLAMRLPWKYASTLARFPAYMIWKLLVSFRGKPKGWIRTERETPRQSELMGRSLDRQVG
jgi:cellulose synthase/poly-beta-1,6-N-acetylglucosamine synthase-like glycosyltransferase